MRCSPVSPWHNTHADGANGSAVPRAPTDPRTRAEYYEAHLAANDSPGYTDDNGGVADGRADPSGWDATDVMTRPSLDIMSEDEIIEKAEALPDRFADRLTESALWSVKRMRGGGEYGLLTIELAASLAAHKSPVTPAERDELLGLLEAMQMPTDPIADLNVQG